jgi:hypothetical protein
MNMELPYNDISKWNRKSTGQIYGIKRGNK